MNFCEKIGQGRGKGAIIGQFLNFCYGHPAGLCHLFGGGVFQKEISVIMEKPDIYTSYPEIPTKQNEISCTTNVDKMSAKDLCRLFPNRLIQTRAGSLYEYTPTLTYNESLGNVIPVYGYTDKQLIDNLIRYPHLFKLMRKIDDEFVSFYSHIEIDGELHRISDVWSTLPESKVIPFSQEYIKEYVVRRYLLERDISHIIHKYPMYGTLDPFLTLFMPASMYVSFGYRNTLDIAKQCVQSRVSYKQSRNPVLRRITDA